MLLSPYIQVYHAFHSVESVMTVGCGCPARVTKGQTLLRRTQLCLISCGPLRCVRGQQKFRQAFDGSEAQQVNQRHVLTALLPDVLLHLY
jgi:hypothetical protein